MDRIDQDSRHFGGPAQGPDSSGQQTVWRTSTGTGQLRTAARIIWRTNTRRKW